MVLLAAWQLKGEVCNMAALICFIEDEFERHRAKFDPCCCLNLIDMFLRETAQNSSLNREDACSKSARGTTRECL